MNEFKLKKGFKALFETTVFDYIHELRMARTLLLDEKMLVNEVAGTIGYKNANHFSTAFKRKFGINPTALDNKLRLNPEGVKFACVRLKSRPTHFDPYIHLPRRENSPISMRSPRVSD